MFSPATLRSRSFLNPNGLLCFVDVRNIPWLVHVPAEQHRGRTALLPGAIVHCAAPPPIGGEDQCNPAKAPCLFNVRSRSQWRQHLLPVDRPKPASDPFLSTVAIDCVCVVAQIEQDPCEQPNLAGKMPAQLAALRRRVHELQQGSVPALNDPQHNPNAREFAAADPKHFGGVWSVWQ